MNRYLQHCIFRKQEYQKYGITSYQVSETLPLKNC